MLVFTSAFRDTVRQEWVDFVERFIEAREQSFGGLAAESMQALRSRAGRAGDLSPAVWSAMVLDLGGDVWLERASCHAEHELLGEPTRTWEVVGSDGRLRAIATVPNNMTILSVYDDRLLATATDEMDVHYLALYRIER